ncbi:PIN domain-containing protein [Brevundimonas aurantiaca]|uniref:Putative nucleic acid-binding protein n=1 Tax=Brevundimonas aurantiaca TaxID=74316 RepID=A0A7W9F9V0_9CAUL|nr:PIN domain-containing protein [Brevundimonas aurantiaca]MBB5741492.1 putative nucleic acid-binding protein [Brevundimonas aurantiaca]
MFANRFTALVDACVLAGALKRNLLLSLAEAEFFRLRWSTPILDETETAIRRTLADRGAEDAADRARRSRQAMERAFEDATVTDFEGMLGACQGLPDSNDAHVLAAALKTRAAIIVTDNLRDFPDPFVRPLNLEVRSADDFLADTIALDPGRAVAAIRRMRERFKRPDRTAEQLLLDMEAAGLTATVDGLRGHVLSL